MRTANPYESPTIASRAVAPKARKRSMVKRFFGGFAIGAVPPASLGAYGLHQFSVYAATLPPGTFVCGNAALGPMMLIVFVAPIIGLIGAAIALVVP